MTEVGGNDPGRSFAIAGAENETFTLAWAAVTDVGHKRRANEDSFVAAPPIFAVADGMGGHLAGDRASAAVVTRLSERIAPDTAGAVSTVDIERALFEATYDIGVVAGDSEIGVGTTVTGVFLTAVDHKPYFGVFNVGDSRVYRYGSGGLDQITTDHSLVQELVDSGLISRAQAHQHPEGNIITRAIGFEDRPVPDYVMVPVRAGMRLLVCSDGLTGELHDDRILLHLSAGLDAAGTAGSLVDAALVAGGRDNVTVIVIDVIDGPHAADVDDDDTAPDGRFGTR